MSIIDENSIDWLDNGEKARAIVLNRPVKQLLDAVNIELNKKVDLLSHADQTTAEGGASNDTWMTPLRVKQYVSHWWNSLGTTFGRGFNNLTDEPNARNYIGLGEVRNFPVATYPQAVEQVVENQTNEAYMTPAMTYQAIKNHKREITGSVQFVSSASYVNTEGYYGNQKKNDDPLLFVSITMDGADWAYVSIFISENQMNNSNKGSFYSGVRGGDWYKTGVGNRMSASALIPGGYWYRIETNVSASNVRIRLVTM